MVFKGIVLLFASDFLLQKCFLQGTSYIKSLRLRLCMQQFNHLPYGVFRFKAEHCFPSFSDLKNCFLPVISLKISEPLPSTASNCSS